MEEQFWGKPRNSCLEFVRSHADLKLECLSRKDFDALFDAKAFKEGPFAESFGSGYGEPYNPHRQAFGTTNDGRCVFCELSKEAPTATKTS